MEGLERFNDGKYAEALEKFLGSDEIEHLGENHYYIGMCYLELDDKEKAADRLHSYIEEGGEDIEPARKKEVEKLLAGVEKPHEKDEKAGEAEEMTLREELKEILDIRKHQLSLFPIAGYGWLLEPDIQSSHNEVIVGAGLEYRPYHMVSFLLDFKYRRYDRDYLTSLTGQSAGVTEDAYEVNVGLRYEILKALGRGGRGDIAPWMGFRYIRFDNDIASVDYMAVPIGLYGRIDASDTIFFALQGGWAYNFFPADTISLIGKPRQSFLYGVTMVMRFPPFVSVSLGYDGETFVHDKAYRFRHEILIAIIIHAT